MKAERIDVATLQECPFYDNDMARLGWPGDWLPCHVLSAQQEPGR